MIADESVELADVLRFMRDENRSRINEFPSLDIDFLKAEGLQRELEEYVSGAGAPPQGK